MISVKNWVDEIEAKIAFTHPKNNTVFFSGHNIIN